MARLPFLTVMFKKSKKYTRILKELYFIIKKNMERKAGF